MTPLLQDGLNAKKRSAEISGAFLFAEN